MNSKVEAAPTPNPSPVESPSPEPSPGPSTPPSEKEVIQIKNSDGDKLVEIANPIIADFVSRGYIPAIFLDKSEAEKNFVFSLSFHPNDHYQKIRLTHTTDISTFRIGEQFKTQSWMKCLELAGVTHCFADIYVIKLPGGG